MSGSCARRGHRRRAPRALPTHPAAGWLEPPGEPLGQAHPRLSRQEARDGLLGRPKFDADAAGLPEFERAIKLDDGVLGSWLSSTRARSPCRSPPARVTRRTTNEAAPEDLRHLRDRRAGRQRQGSAGPIAVLTGRGRSAEPGLGTCARHQRQPARPSSAPVSSRCCRISRASPAEPEAPAGLGERCWPWPATCSSLRRSSCSARSPGCCSSRARARCASGCGSSRGGAWSALWLQQVGGVGGPGHTCCGRCSSAGQFPRAHVVAAFERRGGRAVAATGNRRRGTRPLDVAARASGWSRLVVRGEPGTVDLRVRDARSVAEGRGHPGVDRPGGGDGALGISVLPRRCWRFAGIAGLRLAWSWYHRLAVHPLGSPPAPFRTFAFNDQWVWGWVAAIALVLVPVPEPFRLAGANLLLVLGVLYTTRGLAWSSPRQAEWRARRRGAGAHRGVPVAVRGDPAPHPKKAKEERKKQRQRRPEREHRQEERPRPGQPQARDPRERQQRRVN